jgi:hypothetical protein
MTINASTAKSARRMDPPVSHSLMTSEVLETNAAAADETSVPLHALLVSDSRTQRAFDLMTKIVPAAGIHQNKRLRYINMVLAVLQSMCEKRLPDMPWVT